MDLERKVVHQVIAQEAMLSPPSCFISGNKKMQVQPCILTQIKTSGEEYKILTTCSNLQASGECSPCISIQTHRYEGL